MSSPRNRRVLCFCLVVLRFFSFSRLSLLSDPRLRVAFGFFFALCSSFCSILFQRQCVLESDSAFAPHHLGSLRLLLYVSSLFLHFDYNYVFLGLYSCSFLAFVPSPQESVPAMRAFDKSRSIIQLPDPHRRQSILSAAIFPRRVLNLAGLRRQR